MDLLVVTQYFYPEEFKINNLVQSFVERGYNVCVLTGKPNYPKGQFYKGYSFYGTDYEEYCGAKVIRVPLLKRGRGGSLRLILNYFSFVFFASYYLLTNKIKADSVFCFGTSPILQAIPAIISKKQNHCKLSIWYQDLWPESVFAVTKMKNKALYSVLNFIVRFIYKNTDNILVQSPAFSESILKRGDFSKKITYAPNWAEDIFSDIKSVNIQKYKNLIPDGFIVMYAGNIGAAQDMPAILAAADILKKFPQIHFVIVGDGRDKDKAESIANSYSLQDSVHFLGRYSYTEMPNFFVHADVMIASLKEEEIFALTVPSRIQSYMAFGKPVVTMLTGVGSGIIEDAKCGLTAKSGDYKKLAENILTLFKSDKRILEEMGNNAREYYLNNFDKAKVVNAIIDKL